LNASTKDRGDPAVWFAKVDAARSLIDGNPIAVEAA
jgi:hypothetical protein